MCGKNWGRTRDRLSSRTNRRHSLWRRVWRSFRSWQTSFRRANVRRQRWRPRLWKRTIDSCASWARLGAGSRSKSRPVAGNCRFWWKPNVPESLANSAASSRVALSSSKMADISSTPATTSRPSSFNDAETTLLDSAPAPAPWLGAKLATHTNFVDHIVDEKRDDVLLQRHIVERAVLTLGDTVDRRLERLGRHQSRSQSDRSGDRGRVQTTRHLSLAAAQ